MTYCSLLSFSVLTSKFMWIPRSRRQNVRCHSRSRVSLTRRRRGLRGLQLLDLLCDDGRSRVVRCELQERLVGRDGGLCDRFVCQRGDSLVDRVRPERRPTVAELERRAERRAEGEVAGAQLCLLHVLRQRVCPAEVKPRELPQRLRVLWRELEVSIEDDDRFVGLAVLLQCSREAALRLCA